VGHPHPLYGGTLDNKVASTMARTFAAPGWVSVRPNFRGVGRSEGSHDEGRGETEDWVHVAGLMQQRFGALPIVLAGFSFGAYVASHAAQRLASSGVARLVLVAPAAGRFDLAAVPPDTLVIHGEADDVVPLAAVLDWARPQALPVTVVPGAGHFFHGQLLLLKSLVLRTHLL
jgi:alpha/beta superfamily hydrolase